MHRTFQIIAKPAGPACNLACSYCFYLGKPAHARMSGQTLACFIRSRIETAPGGEVDFIWQGGEPTLLGTAFFAEVVSLQKQFAQGKTIRNALQTHGGLLDAQWGRFLSREDFLVGLSIDGPEKLHNTCRTDKKGQPTFDATLRGMDILRQHGVRFNTLTVVGPHNVAAPDEVYGFLKEAGSGHMQFIALYEPGQPSLVAEAWGEFLVRIFDVWVRNDVGRYFVQQFDAALAIWLGLPSPLCLFASECGRNLAIEANGDVFSCDHFVDTPWRLGNLHDATLASFAGSTKQQAFGAAKARLPGQCLRCEVRFACQGECPKNRTVSSQDGEAGLNALCAGYRRFFNHISDPMHAMARLLQTGRPASDIMQLLNRPGAIC
jgi:uncharacterized protein